MRKIILIILIISSVYSDEYYYSDGKKIYLKELNSNIKRSHKTSHNKKDIKVKYYTTKSGAVLGVNNDILVKCKKNKNCKQQLLKYDFEKIEEISTDYYLLHLDDNTKIFSLSREIYKESYIELSHPDFEMTHTAY